MDSGFDVPVSGYTLYMSSLKKELTEALRNRDYTRVTELALNDKRTFGKLIAIAYNKDELLCWRAIEAIGPAAAAVSRDNVAAVRNVVQRLIWSAREESGGMGWSTPELLAEIVIAAPRKFADIPPIIMSLHSEDEEKVFLKGVLWAAGRMGEAGITEIPGSEEVITDSLKSEDPSVRGLAVWAAVRAGVHPDGLISGLSGDQDSLTIYEDGELVQRTVGELAQQAIAA